jgi:hypothetical protein
LDGLAIRKIGKNERGGKVSEARRDDNIFWNKRLKPLPGSAREDYDGGLIVMGKQYNKVQKRRRRLAYVDRLKEAAKAARKPGRPKIKPGKKSESPAEAAA